jgi:hypothetical protein
MRQRKLQCGGLQRHGELLAQGFEPAHAFQHRVGRRRVVVMGPVAGARAGRKNARIERSAAEDGHAAFHAEWQQLLEGGLLEQRVAPGEQDAVELAAPEQLDAHFPFVHADADGLHGAGGA